MAANAPMLIKATMVDGKPEVGILPTGQVTGVIDELPTVAELLDAHRRRRRRHPHPPRRPPHLIPPGCGEPSGPPPARPRCGEQSGPPQA